MDRAEAKKIIDRCNKVCFTYNFDTQEIEKTTYIDALATTDEFDRFQIKEHRFDYVFQVLYRDARGFTVEYEFDNKLVAQAYMILRVEESMDWEHSPLCICDSFKEAEEVALNQQVL